MTPSQMSAETGSLYRVFAPFVTDGRISGAVEIVERLDDAPTVAVLYRRNAVWLAIIGVVFIGLSLLFLFHLFVDRPVASLLDAMRHVEAGDFEGALTCVGTGNTNDEFGRLSPPLQSDDRARPRNDKRA